MDREYEFLIDQVENRPGLVSFSDVRKLIYYACLSPENTQYVELGPYLGKSTAAICSVSTRRGAALITIDNFKHTFRYGSSNQAKVRKTLESFGATELTIITGDSALVPSCIDKVGFLFTDTEHTNQKLTQELNAWVPYMVKGAILTIHDYSPSFPGLVAAVDRLLKNSPSWKHLGQMHSLIAFRKLV